MHINDFDYKLPEELIARYPLPERDGCRLLRVGRSGGETEHLMFRDILNILKPGDRLVFNDTKVIPARVFFKKDTGAAVELLFTERIDGSSWKALVKPSKRAKAGTELFIDGHPGARVRVDGVDGGGYERIVSLAGDGAAATSEITPAAAAPGRIAEFKITSIDEIIERFGHIPLPHYIGRGDDEADRELYQTVYAARPGAVAAPTAGLHFTDRLLAELDSRGVSKSFVTLHVGIGTFRPVQAEDPRLHDMHEERFEMDGRTAEAINSTWRNGGRVIAVGTTVVRTLESCAAARRAVVPKSSRTKIMICPPYEFKAVDGLITNFHLPKSTLMMLVSAFAARGHILSAYDEAVRRRYRFFSYGDAMIII